MKVSLNTFLPYILYRMNGKHRYLPTLEYKKGCLIHNLFRFWESVAWREIGIKPSMTSIIRGSETYLYFHCVEAFLAHSEGWIRSRFILKPFKIYLPILITPYGIPIPASPYVFAIAFDTSSNGVTATGTATVAHTTTGSNLIMISGVVDQGITSGVGNVTGVTYNSVAETFINGISANTTADTTAQLYGQLNPSTGTNNVVATRTVASDSMWVANTTYTGVSQATAIGSLTQATASNALGVNETTFTVTLTAPTNGWAVLSSYSRGAGAAAGTGTTQRALQLGQAGLWDTNAAVSGSTTLQGTQNSNWWAGAMVAFAPAATGSATTYNLSLLGSGT